MKVRDLLEVLKAQDPDAEVCMVCQPTYATEHAVRAAVVRGDLMDTVDDPDLHRPLRLDRGAARSDVLLVEGEWLRRSSRAAWKSTR